jgi:diguanylate cyclase (GGDEF)-like protein
MADIDHFKDFNDLHGHQAGDEVLRGVAATLDGGKREVDRVYRYGGEELAVLLPETDWSEARDVAEKLRSRVEELTVESEGSGERLSVTVSMGVASFPNDSEDIETLTAGADEALYAAKEGGRNRVTAYAEMPHGKHEGQFKAHPR